MIFYMIEDLNSGKWYKRGSHGGQWVKQSEASVWTTKAGPSACLGSISAFRNRLVRKPRVPREPEVRTIDTEGNDAMEALLELVTVIKHREIDPDGQGLADRWNFALASAQQVLAINIRSVQ